MLAPVSSGGNPPKEPTIHDVRADLRVAPPGRADEGTRTLDTWLGKPVLYQLSYVRVTGILAPP